jgi:hypothetical protein
MGGSSNREAKTMARTPDYTKLTDEKAYEILTDLIVEMSAPQILSCGDVAAELKEHLNNEILNRWVQENPELAYPAMTQAEFVEAKGGKCPRCHSGDLDGQDFDQDGAVLKHKIYCNDCGATWSERWTLKGFEMDEEAHPF